MKTATETALADRVAQLEAQVAELRALLKDITLVKISSQYGDAGSTSLKTGNSMTSFTLGVWHLLPSTDAAQIEQMEVNPLFTPLRYETRKL